MTRDPLHISYDDLIKMMEGRLAFMEKNYPKMKLQGSISAWTASHNVACVKALLTMLRKHKKDPQLNLFDLFEKVK